MESPQWWRLVLDGPTQKTIGVYTTLRALYDVAIWMTTDSERKWIVEQPLDPEKDVGKLAGLFRTFPGSNVLVSDLSFPLPTDASTERAKRVEMAKKSSVISVGDAANLGDMMQEVGRTLNEQYKSSSLRRDDRKAVARLIVDITPDPFYGFGKASISIELDDE